MAFLGEYSSQELLQGQLLLWHQSLSFFKPVALAVAKDLRIADAIHRLGGAATLPQIIAEAGINPCKLRALRRVMRVLTVSGIFTAVQQPATATAAAASGGGGTEGPVYKLTAASSLLVVGEKSSTAAAAATTKSQLPPSLSVQVQLFLDPCRGSAFSSGIRAWFRQDEHQQPAGLSPFALACDGQTIWERAERDADVFPFDDAMASDNAFLMPIVLKECGDVFRGLTSLVDVAGGLGGAASTIAAAFPDLKCTVLDLPQVIAKAPSAAGTSVQYVAGDMFQSIPPADAVFLKLPNPIPRSASCRASRDLRRLPARRQSSQHRRHLPARRQLPSRGARRSPSFLHRPSQVAR
ncbi:hypothetical protein BDA96_04G365500 [Sorghum bicolor]|uniref:O-methyltransferase domain-containing protein n=1 Tax=Sorghum bicolor TaxID=4558 RepID=A0A921R984_SORBI|nr:hypothetical protein BDA96_04G365500 [Sorghum bicolor]KAG0535430.1 hypothetical protein BDA96_04G365500 [Sorghum bicolor]